MLFCSIWSIGSLFCNNIYHMEVETDPTYSEIIELSTFPKRNSEVLDNPIHLQAENKTNSHVSFDTSLDLSDHPKKMVRKNGMLVEPITYRKVSETEEIDDSLYENVITSSTAPQITASRDPIFSSSFLEFSEKEDTFPLCKRLKHSKKRMRFQEFAYYAMETLFIEVEQIACLDFIYFVLSVGILTIGFMFVEDCKISSIIPVMMVLCGLGDSAASLLSFFQTLMLFQGRREIQLCRPIIRAIRLLMLLARLYGLALVYEILPPEEKNRNSYKYCNSYVYWLSFFYFHLFTLTSVTTGLAMLIAAATYYM